MSEEAPDFIIAATQATFNLGQSADRVLNEPAVFGFFMDRAKVIANELVNVDASDQKSVAAVVLALQALAAFNNHLTKAVTAGMAASQRLGEIKGENK